MNLRDILLRRSIPEADKNVGDEDDVAAMLSEENSVVTKEFNKAFKFLSDSVNSSSAEDDAVDLNLKQMM